MKKFDLEAAKNGAAVCLRDGTPVKILDFEYQVKNCSEILYKYYNKELEMDQFMFANMNGENKMIFPEGYPTEEKERFVLFMAPVYSYAKIYKNRIIKELYSGKLCATAKEAAIQKDEVYPDLEYFGMAKIEIFYEDEGGEE